MLNTIDFFLPFQGELHQNQNWACFVRYLKIIKTV